VKCSLYFCFIRTEYYLNVSQFPWVEPQWLGNNGNGEGMDAMVWSLLRLSRFGLYYSEAHGRGKRGGSGRLWRASPPNPGRASLFEIHFVCLMDLRGLKWLPASFASFCYCWKFQVAPPNNLETKAQKTPEHRPQRQVCRLVAVLFYFPMLTIGLELWASGKTVYNRGKAKALDFCWRPKTLIGGAPK